MTDLYRCNALFNQRLSIAVGSQAVMCLCLLASPSKGDVLVERLTSANLDLFYSFCPNNDSSFEALSALADELLWPRLPSQVVDRWRPTEAVGDFEGWIGKLEEFSPFNFFVYGGAFKHDESLSIETCSFFFGDTNAEEFEAMVKSDMGEASIHSEIEGNMRIHTYRCPCSDQIHISTRIDESTVNGRGVFASATIFLAKESE